MSKKKSRFNIQGGSHLTWDAIDRFGIRTRRQYKQAKHENEIAHIRDEIRQETDLETRWDIVRSFLDMGLALSDTKRIAGSQEEKL